MRLDHDFNIPASPAQVWKVLTDPLEMAPCMPGASLVKVEGATFTGAIKVKLGPISLTYRGSGKFLETDDATRKIVIAAAGKDVRDGDTAAATVTVTLSEEGETTKGKVKTDLDVTGRPAQFGPDMISEVYGRILDQFAMNLAKKLGGLGPTQLAPERHVQPSAVEMPSVPEQPKLEAIKPAPQHEVEAIDLLEYAGGSVAKRIAPVIASVAGVLLIVAIIRASHGRRRPPSI